MKGPVDFEFYFPILVFVLIVISQLKRFKIKFFP